MMRGTFGGDAVVFFEWSIERGNRHGLLLLVTPKKERGGRGKRVYHLFGHGGGERGGSPLFRREKGKGERKGRGGEGRRRRRLSPLPEMEAGKEIKKEKWEPRCATVLPWRGRKEWRK